MTEKQTQTVDYSIILIVALMLVGLPVVHAQHKTNFFFNEFGVSVNRTLLSGSNSKNKTGFGIGAYNVLFDTSFFNVVIGLEFAHTTFFKEFENYGRFSSLNDITFTKNAFLLPLKLRFTFGNELKAFMEYGARISAGNWKIKATESYCYPEEIAPNEWEFKCGSNKVKRDYDPASSYDKSLLPYDFTAGLGCSVPIKTGSMFLRGDYILSPIASYYRIMAGLHL